MIEFSYPQSFFDYFDNIKIFNSQKCHNHSSESIPNHLQDGDVYEWSDGTYPGAYNNWLRSQDSNIEGEKCAVMDTEVWDCPNTCEYPDGNWMAKNCTQKHPYMCKIKEGLLNVFNSYINFQLI